MLIIDDLSTIVPQIQFALRKQSGWQNDRVRRYGELTNCNLMKKKKQICMKS